MSKITSNQQETKFILKTVCKGKVSSLTSVGIEVGVLVGVDVGVFG